MTALVEICHARKAIITGSDVEDRFYTDEILEKIGIKAKTFSKDNVDSSINLVVYSAAYKLDINPDLIKATELGIPCFLYTEALGAISKASYSCGVCGVHGKTTTTGITGTLIDALNLPAQVLVGSGISSFGGSCTLTKGDKYFVAETCEYQRHFMDFRPKKIILTSVELDHQDYFADYKDIQSAFLDYINLLPQNGALVYCADDQGAKETAEIAFQKRPDLRLIPYGVTASGDYKVTFGNIDDGKQYFSLAGFDKDFAIKIPGHHIVLDAVAAMALALELVKEENPGKQFSNEILEQVATGLLNFAGAKRRSEILGEKDNVLFIDDYGHHPTAIKKTLEGIKSFYPDRYLICDFMSHTYTRTASLLEEFASCFDSADEVILHKIYPSAREIYSGSVSGKILFARAQNYHNNVKYFEEVMDAKSYLEKRFEEAEKNKTGYLFVTMGAGDNWKLGKALLES
jgi:UDP-N-acetylmuramate--alanine ligase